MAVADILPLVRRLSARTSRLICLDNKKGFPMAHLLDALNDRVLLGDGPFGTSVQAMDLDVEKDFHGHENLYNYLVRSRPDVIRKIHRDYFIAGADVAMIAALWAVHCAATMGVAAGAGGGAPPHPRSETAARATRW